MAVISDMNQPLGNAIGNALEIEESIAILKGEGPADITELILTLGSQMVVLAGKASTLDEARQLLQGVIDDGRALEAFRQMIIYQGGDPAVIENPKLMPQAQYQIELPAKENGYVTEMTANEMGIASMLLGGGRQAKTDEIDYAVGLVLHKKIGDPVQKGESLLTIYSNREDIEAIKDLLYDNIKVGSKAQKVTLIHALIQ